MINLLPKTEVINATDKVCYPAWQAYRRHSMLGASAFVLKVFIFILLAALLDITGLIFATPVTRTETLTNESDYVAVDGELVFTDEGAFPKPSAGDTISLVAEDFSSGVLTDTIIKSAGLELAKTEISLSADMVFYTDFEDSAGLLVDETGNMVSYDFFGDIQKSAEGAIGEAYIFDGKDDAINVNFTFQQRLGDMTVSLWVKKDNYDNSLDYFLDGRPSGNFWIMNDYVGGSVCADPNGNICFYDVVEITSDLLTPGVWQYLAFTITSDTTTAYLNGEAVDFGVGYMDARYPGTAMYLGDSLRIGSRLNNKDYNQGEIDEIAIYNRALSSQEVLELAGRFEHVGTFESAIIDLSGADIFDIQLVGENTDLATVYYRVCESATVCDGNYIAWHNEPIRETHFIQLSLQLNAGNNDSVSPTISQIEVIKSNYPDSISVVPIAGLSFSQNQSMNTLSALALTPGGSSLRFQISTDAGESWQWFDGESWLQVTSDVDNNTDSQITSALSELDVSDSVFIWKAMLISDGLNAPFLESITLTYQSNTVIPSEPIIYGGMGGSSQPDYPTNEKPESFEVTEDEVIENLVKQADSGNTETVEAEEDSVGGGPGYAPHGQAYSPVTGEVEEITPVVAGDYIRSSSFSTVYFVTDDYSRRPFWNTQTFMTWEDSFDNVKWVTDATLTVLPLYKPMMPKPETVLVKIQSDSKVYWTEQNDRDQLEFTLRWITKEQIAKEVFGENWADYVLDIEPTLFSNLKFGEDINQPKELAGKIYDLAKIRKN